jgi:hypothetical protein
MSVEYCGPTAQPCTGNRELACAGPFMSMWVSSSPMIPWHAPYVQPFFDQKRLQRDTKPQLDNIDSKHLWAPVLTSWWSLLSIIRHLGCEKNFTLFHSYSDIDEHWQCVIWGSHIVIHPPQVAAQLHHLNPSHIQQTHVRSCNGALSSLDSPWSAQAADLLRISSYRSHIDMSRNTVTGINYPQLQQLLAISDNISWLDVQTS